MRGGSLLFGNRRGTVTSTLTISISASSPAAVTFDPFLAVTNSFGTAFTKGADTCSGQTLPPGGTCTVVVNFAAPAGFSYRAGTLTVPHTGALSPSPLILSLSGY